MFFVFQKISLKGLKAWKKRGFEENLTVDLNGGFEASLQESEQDNQAEFCCSSAAFLRLHNFLVW
jgi:hypothetical protein